MIHAGIVGGLDGLGAGRPAVKMTVASRNPCERVRNHFCRVAVDPVRCQNYQEILRESVQDESSAMRSMIRDQCVTKINRMKEEDGITVR